jgi:hypothetical protein
VAIPRGTEFRYFNHPSTFAFLKKTHLS